MACVGRCRDEVLRSLSDRYETRLRRHAAIEVVEVAAAPAGMDRGEALRLEATALRRVAGLDVPGRSGAPGRRAPVAAGPRAVVALDERGETPGSRDLARQLDEWLRRGTRQVTFLVGGDGGLAPDLLAACDSTLSLSRLTFTHELARVLLLEQLYRAHAIRAGHPYHRD